MGVYYRIWCDSNRRDILPYTGYPIFLCLPPEHRRYNLCDICSKWRSKYIFTFDGTNYTPPANANDLISVSIAGGWGLYNTSTFAPISKTAAELYAIEKLSGYTFFFFFFFGEAVAYS